MHFNLHHVVILLLGTLLAATFSLSTEDTSPAVWHGTRALGVQKRESNSCRSKCSSKSCCQLDLSDSDEEDTDVSTRSLDARTLFPVSDATVDADIVQRFTDKKVKLIFSDDAESDESTSAWKPITTKSRAFDLGLSALCGCTTLIVHSENGAYGAHFFEAAAWGEGDDAFQQYVVDFLKNGANGQKGLAEFADRLTKGNADVAAYILTPANSEQSNSDQLLYQDQIEQLVSLLSTIIPGLEGRIQVNDYEALEGGRDGDGTDINPQEANLLDTTSRGRVLFQYDPQDNGLRTARLFFETRLIFSRSLGTAQ